MTHYICPTCGGEAEKLGKCQTEGCERMGKPLEMCECIDGTHSKDEVGDLDGMNEMDEMKDEEV